MNSQWPKNQETATRAVSFEILSLRWIQFQLNFLFEDTKQLHPLCFLCISYNFKKQCYISFQFSKLKSPCVFDHTSSVPPVSHPFYIFDQPSCLVWIFFFSFYCNLFLFFKVLYTGIEVSFHRDAWEIYKTNLLEVKTKKERERERLIFILIDIDINWKNVMVVYYGDF